MRSNIYLRKLVLLILLPALSWLFFNSIYYRHLHQLSTGIIISHSHPFEKTTKETSDSPFASHNHSEEEFFLYDTISNTILYFLLAFFGSLLFILFIVKELKNQFLLGDYTQDTFLLQPYRGPPVFC
jgi:hypothetical protein